MESWYIVDIKKCYKEVPVDEAVELFSKLASIDTHDICLHLEQINYDNNTCNLYVETGAISTPNGRLDACIKYQLDLISDFLEKGDMK